MKCTIISQFLLVISIAVASNSLLSLAAKRTSNNVGSEVEQEFLLSACVPNSDKNGNTCRPQ